MLKLFFTVILLNFIQISFGQPEPISRDNILFENGILLKRLINEELDLDKAIKSKDSIKSKYASEIKEAILKKALASFTELIDSFPNSKLLVRTLDFKGTIEYELNYINEAKKTFQSILNSKIGGLVNTGFKSEVIEDPYSYLKNEATERLANIFIDEKNYTEALKYLDLTKIYPYEDFCGNAVAADKLYIAESYAKCYLELNELPKAYEILLPNILDNSLVDNSHLIETTYNALLLTYKKEDLKNQFKQAFLNYQAEKVTSNNEEYERYFITFLKTRIEFMEFRTDDSERKNK